MAMALITGFWTRFRQMFSILAKPTRRKTRVRFSPSTVHRDVQRTTKLRASTHAFQNFLAELRLASTDDDMEVPDNIRLTRTATGMWRKMSEEQKEPYRRIALQQKEVKRLCGNRQKQGFLAVRRLYNRASRSGVTLKEFYNRDSSPGCDEIDDTQEDSSTLIIPLEENDNCVKSLYKRHVSQSGFTLKQFHNRQSSSDDSDEASE